MTALLALHCFINVWVVNVLYQTSDKKEQRKIRAIVLLLHIALQSRMGFSEEGFVCPEGGEEIQPYGEAVSEHGHWGTRKTIAGVRFIYLRQRHSMAGFAALVPVLLLISRVLSTELAVLHSIQIAGGLKKFRCSSDKTLTIVFLSSERH